MIITYLLQCVTKHRYPWWWSSHIIIKFNIVYVYFMAGSVGGGVGDKHNTLFIVIICRYMNIIFVQFNKIKIRRYLCDGWDTRNVRRWNHKQIAFYICLSRNNLCDVLNKQLLLKNCKNVRCWEETETKNVTEPTIYRLSYLKG